MRTQYLTGSNINHKYDIRAEICYTQQSTNQIKQIEYVQEAKQQEVWRPQEVGKCCYGVREEKWWFGDDDLSTNFGEFDS